jgi:iron complex outermembrane receptor protein
MRDWSRIKCGDRFDVNARGTKMKKFLLSVAIVPLFALPDPGLTQELEEITVTAARREQTLNTLPISASVFSSEQLEQFRMLEPRDLDQQTPGLLTKYGPNGLATVGFYMRGVGINDFTGTVDPSLGIYVDEVFMPTPDMLNFAVFDVERVEVLRGPQGTLYGRNSTAGAINFITAAPTREFEGYVRGEYGSYGTGRITGALSGAISDTLMGRLSVDYRTSSSNDGWSFNRFTGNELGKLDQTAIRGQLLWEPSEAFSARVIYSFGDHESEQPLLQHIATRDSNNLGAICDPVIAGRRAEGDCVNLLGYFDPDNAPYDGDANLDPTLEIESDDISLIMNWEASGFTVTSITGYNDFSKFQSQDIDASPNVAADNETENTVENFSQEVRLTSDDSHNIGWIVGANYATTDVNWFQTIDLSELAGIPTSNGADQTTDSWAIFGQVTVPLSDSLEISGGLRYTDEEREWQGATFVGTFLNLQEALASGAPRLSQLPLPPNDPNAGGPLDFPNVKQEENVDFSLVLKYTPSDNAMYYLRIAEGFRSGGFSSAVIFSQDALEPYEPEELLAYEVGLKLSSSDNRLRFDSSAFYYDYQGFQATFVRANEANARLQNAGDVEIYGLEASLDWLPTEQWDLNLGLSLLDSEIVSTSVVLPPLDGGPEVTIAGNEIPNAPGFSINGRARYYLPLGSSFLAALQADFTSVDEHFLEPNNREVLKADSYTLVNARVEVGPREGPWRVSAFVRNIGDEVYRTAAQDLALALGFNEMVLGFPRTWGLQFEYQF